MANNYITWQTSNDLAMQDNMVLETVAGTTFPVGFGTVNSGTATVMVIVNRDVLGTNSASASETAVVECLERIIKKLHESVNLN